MTMKMKSVKASKNAGYNKIEFTLGKIGLATLKRFAWGWADAGEAEITLEQFANFEFYEVELEDGNKANAFKMRSM